MIVGPLIKNAPVIGSCYGFATTAIKVYNATSPSKAIIVGVKGIILDCTLPVIKYPALTMRGISDMLHCKCRYRR